MNALSTARRALGIDIGGTKIAVAAVDDSGSIAHQVAIPTEAEQGFDRGVRRIIDAAELVLSRAGWDRAQLCGVGIGCTGPVSPRDGMINNPYTLPTWDRCPIVARLTEEFQLPVYLENDADAAALGECFAGAARGRNQVVMLTLGTGVGGSAILHGQVYRGTQGEHPELGHIPIDPHGPPCYCGTSGCLESICCGTAITVAGQQAGFADSRAVFAAAAGDAPEAKALATAILERARRALGTATWTLLHTFMPEVIVLGGGIIDEHYEWFAAPVVEQIARATMVPAGGTCVTRAHLGNDAGLVGAASLAFTRT